MCTTGDQCIAVEYLERIDAAGDAALDERREFTTVPGALDYLNTETVRAVNFKMERTSPENPIQLQLRSARAVPETFKLAASDENEILDACV